MNNIGNNLFEFEVEEVLDRFEHPSRYGPERYVHIHVCVIELLEGGTKVELYYKYTRSMSRDKPSQ